MKKFAALFLAVLTLAGCSSKKNSDTEPPVENDDKAVEEEVKVYSKDEFRRVDLDLQTVKKDMGIKIEELDLSQFDFGERLSPCKTSDDPYFYKRHWESSEDYNRLFEESLKAPAKGKPVYASMDGDDMYIYASYDPYCESVHSFGVFRCDISTGELREVASFERKNENVSDVSSCPVVDGGLFYIDYENNCIMKKDLETGEESVFYTGIGTIDYIIAREHSLSLLEYNENGGGIKIIDAATGEIQNSEQLGSDPYLYADPDGEWWTEITPGTEKELDIITDKFRLSTGLRTFSGVFLRGNKLSILVSIGNVGSSDKRLYTYDTDTMEVYVTDVTLLGFPSKVEDGNLLFTNYNYNTFGMSYFVPEIGTAFEVEIPEVPDGYIEIVGLSYGLSMYCVRDDENFIKKLMWISEQRDEP